MMQDRHLGGAPGGQGGRWRGREHGTADMVRLTPDSESILRASTDELWRLIHHPDHAVRLTAARAVNLSTEQLHALADPDTQPPIVRLAVAGLLNPGVADRAANDPNPLVRLQAAATGWDLPDRVRNALVRDQEVALAGAVLARA